MTAKAWIYQRFDGGNATDKKAGIDNSFANSQSLDFRKSPSQISVLPQPHREDNNIVVDLVQNEVMIQDGTIYALGDQGFIYRRKSDGTWSTFGKIPSGTFGMEYRQDQDTIFIASKTAVSTITTVSTNPVLNISYYSTSLSTYDNSSQMGFNVDSNQTGSTSTTAITTTYVEGMKTQTRYFQTDINPVKQIGVYVVSKGTGNWTLVVHDGLGNLLGTSTITNANLVNNQMNFFSFTNAINVNVGPNNAQTYHFHVTSTVADGTISSSATNDLSTCDMQLYANRLVNTTNGIHPIQTFQQFITIGNGRYLSTYEPLGEITPTNSQWERQKLSFPPGYEVCGLTVFNEYLVIATGRTTTGNSTPQDGIIFYWDGLSSTYNYFTRIPEGTPEGIHEYENVIYYVAGGNWYAITSVAATPTKIRRLPGSENVYTSSNSITHINPYSATVRYGIQLLGYPATTTNQDIQYGVYSWGKVDYGFPNAFGYSYLISTGSQKYTPSNNLSIGMVKNFGNMLHISWRDGIEYGVDIVDAASTPASYAFWESLIFDNGYVTKWKQALYVDASWLTMQDGVQIQLRYSLDRGDWVKSPMYSNDNLFEGYTGFAKFHVSPQSRFREIQVGIDIYCDSTVTEPPTIVSVGLIYDDMSGEALQ